MSALDKVVYADQAAYNGTTIENFGSGAERSSNKCINQFSPIVLVTHINFVG